MGFDGRLTYPFFQSLLLVQVLRSFYLESRFELNGKFELKERGTFSTVDFMGGARFCGVRGRGGVSVRMNRIVFGVYCVFGILGVRTCSSRRLAIGG